ncbi:MAG: hypothetical protein ACJ75J_14700 [Cytophagaceae bacterium]
MKKLILSFLIAAGSLAASAQTETPPGAVEKNEVNKLLTHYNLYMGKISPEDKAKFMKYYVWSPLIYVYNDMDTLAKPDDFITLMEYDKKVHAPISSFIFGGSLKPETVKTGNVKFDKERNYYYIDAEVEKMYSGRVIQTTTSSEGATVITNRYLELSPKTLHFVIAFERSGTIPKNFKIAAISLKGTEPKLPEIKK